MGCCSILSKVSPKACKKRCPKPLCCSSYHCAADWASRWTKSRMRSGRLTTVASHSNPLPFSEWPHATPPPSTRLANRAPNVPRLHWPKLRRLCHQTVRLRGCLGPRWPTARGRWVIGSAPDSAVDQIRSLNGLFRWEFIVKIPVVTGCGKVSYGIDRRSPVQELRRPAVGRMSRSGDRDTTGCYRSSGDNQLAASGLAVALASGLAAGGASEERLDLAASINCLSF